MDKKINIVLVLLVISTILQILVFARPYIRGLESSAYSKWRGDYAGAPAAEVGSSNCFDARLNGEEVMECLGIPGFRSSDGPPYLIQ